jgi:hypothetical protein
MPILYIAVIMGKYFAQKLQMHFLSREFYGLLLTARQCEERFRAGRSDTLDGDCSLPIAVMPKSPGEQPMRSLNLAIALGLVTSLAPSLSAQTTATINVTTSPITVSATSTGYFAVLYENSSTPSATFVVTPAQFNGTQMAPVNVSVGAAYVFTRPLGSPFAPGDVLGSVAFPPPQLGPYTLVLVQYANPPNAPLVSAVKCATGMSVSQINPDGTTVCSSASPLSQWNPALNAVTFVAPAGTQSAPVWFSSADPYAQARHAGTEFVENPDGQFEIATLTDGFIAALLNLDTDGHIALYGANGGGIATDQMGNTCLANANGGCWNVVFANNGPLINYRGVATKGGDGLPIILFGGASYQSGNFGPFTMYTTPAAGYTATSLFRVSGYIVATSAAPGATLEARINYTDASGANSQDTGLPIPFGNVGAKLPFSFILQSTPSQQINLSVITTNTPVYLITGTIEAL